MQKWENKLLNFLPPPKPLSHTKILLNPNLERDGILQKRWQWRWHFVGFPLHSAHQFPDTSISALSIIWFVQNNSPKSILYINSSAASFLLKIKYRFDFLFPVVVAERSCVWEREIWCNGKHLSLYIYW